MTREEIREGIARIGFERGLGTLDKFYDGIENIPAELLQTLWDDEMGWAIYQIEHLHSQGLVLKVERETEEELMARHASEYAEGSTNMSYKNWTIAHDMFPKELVAVEPLIKEIEK